MTGARASAWAPRLCVLMLWLLCAAVLLWLSREHIARMNFRDTDDALRLTQVRDWLAGQSWFDVTQYRIHPPQGVPMHWSRLADLPLAGAVVLLRLFTDPLNADRWACAGVPLLNLLGLFWAVSALTRRVSGDAWLGVIAAAMLAFSLGILIQVQPMRVDHHGWQILLNTIAVLFTIDAMAGDRRRAGLAALFMACSLTVALESLPLAVAVGAALAWHYLRDERRGGALATYLLALAGSGALLLAGLEGWPRGGLFWCDALSPAYVLPLIGTAITLPLAMRLIGTGTLAHRMITLALASGVGVALFATAAPQCLAGPFASLDPLVYRLWYRSVGEGIPVWAQSPDVQLLVPIPSLIGLVGTLLALRTAPPATRAAWWALLPLQLLAFIVSLLVMRAMGIAHALALPGAAFLLSAALRAARQSSSAPIRVLLGAGTILLTPVGAQAIALGFLPDTPEDAPPQGGARFGCTTAATLHGLQAIPPTVLFTPLDIGSHILVYTRHSVVATGHHRNTAGMKAVISAFVSTPATARPLVTGSNATYMAFCPNENEVRKYIRTNPGSLMALLNRGGAPQWLHRVPMPRGETIRVYRIVR